MDRRPDRPDHWKLAGAVFRLAALFLPLAILGGTPAAAMEIVVPAYFYPTLGPQWQQLAAAAGRVPLTAILNPASGPGNSPDPNYVIVVNQLRASGGKVVGYVDTNYAQRVPALVKADIDSFPAFYAVDGIFLDQMANDTLAAHYAYYADIYAYIKAHHPTFRVFGNPDTWTQEAYVSIPTVDVVCTYENSTPYADYVPDPWVFGYTPDRFYHIPHSVPTAAEMRADLVRAASRNVGALFVTDDVLPNPYDRLPVYWDEEVAAVESLQVAAAPTTPPAMATSASGLRVFPNPSRGDCVIRWAGAASAAPSDLRLFDVTGRTVASWRPEGGAPAVRWGGRDREGRLVTPGMYFLRWRDDFGRDLRTRMIITR